jgi:hypothetical protein
MPSPRRRRRSDPPVAGIVIGVVLFLVVAGAVWFWFQRDAPVEVDPDAPAAEAPPEPEVDPMEEPEVPPLDLPELGASDELVRSMVARLSEHPQLAAWLVNDELVRRFVGVIVDLSGASNPASHVRFMTPDEDFRAREIDGRLVIDPDSYRRYDLLAATFASLDTQGTVQLYRQMRPLINEAYSDLGIPDHTFDELLAMAIRNLLAIEVPTSPPEVELVEGIYEYRDSALENRPGAAKALMRMGPDNTRRIQEQVRALARELGVEPN